MSPAPTTTTIRLYCDGELPPEQAAELERLLETDAELRARVEFERALRRHVAAAMTEAPVPGALEQQVRAAVAGDGVEVAGRIAPEQPRETVPWWRAPKRANVFAVAACLVLIAGAVLFGILAPPIDAWRTARPADPVFQAAAVVAGEHRHANSSAAVMERMFAHHERPEASRALKAQLGATPVFDLRELGYRFRGGAPCNNVPRCDNGCHLYYARRDEPRASVSLHVVGAGALPLPAGEPNPDGLPIPSRRVRRSPDCPAEVLVWAHADRAYLLVVDRDEDAADVARLMQQALLNPAAAD